jgi:hypothetical protein
MAAHCGCLATGQASIAEAIMPKIRYREEGSTSYTLVFAEGLERDAEKYERFFA